MEILEANYYKKAEKIYEEVNKAIFRIKFLSDVHPTFENFEDQKMEKYLDRANKVLQLEGTGLEITADMLQESITRRKSAKGLKCSFKIFYFEFKFRPNINNIKTTFHT